MRASLLSALFSVVFVVGAAALAADPPSSDRFLVEASRSSYPSDGGAGSIVDGGVYMLTQADSPTLVWGNGYTSTRSVAAVCTTGTCTRPDPLAATEGLLLDGIASCRYTLCAEAPLADGGLATVTLGGSGTVETWDRDPTAVTAQKWGYVKEDLSVNATGDVCQTWPVLTNSMRGNGWRVVMKPNGVTTSVTDGGLVNLVSTLRCCLAKERGGCGQ